MKHTFPFLWKYILCVCMYVCNNAPVRYMYYACIVYMYNYVYYVIFKIFYSMLLHYCVFMCSCVMHSNVEHRIYILHIYIYIYIIISYVQHCYYYICILSSICSLCCILTPIFIIEYTYSPTVQREFTATVD